MRKTPGQQQLQAEARKRIEEENSELLQSALEEFGQHLKSYCERNTKKINEDPEFRHKFLQFFMDRILGLRTFYAELAVQVLSISAVCRSGTYAQGVLIDNAGCMTVEDCLTRVRAMRDVRTGASSPEARAVDRFFPRMGAAPAPRPTENRAISETDIVRCVGKLDVLGQGGLRIVEAEGGDWVVAIPLDLRNDSMAALRVIESQTADRTAAIGDIKKHLNWDSTRAGDALKELEGEGIVWIDWRGKEKVYCRPPNKFVIDCT